jgi:hypothetical protein
MPFPKLFLKLSNQTILPPRFPIYEIVSYKNFPIQKLVRKTISNFLTNPWRTLLRKYNFKIPFCVYSNQYKLSYKEIFTK